MLHEQLTSTIISNFFIVYNTLGYGFLEKVYENAMAYKLRQSGLHIHQQARIVVTFEGIVVGEYFADLLVENQVIVELKAAQSITPAHQAQLINYLKATGIEVGLLLNFGPEATFARRVFTIKRGATPIKSA